MNAMRWKRERASHISRMCTCSTPGRAGTGRVLDGSPFPELRTPPRRGGAPPEARLSPLGGAPGGSQPLRRLRGPDRDRVAGGVRDARARRSTTRASPRAASPWSPATTTCTPRPTPGRSPSTALWRPSARRAPSSPGKIIECPGFNVLPLDVARHQPVTRSAGWLEDAALDVVAQRAADRGLSDRPMLVVQHHPPFVRTTQPLHWLDGLVGRRADDGRARGLPAPVRPARAPALGREPGPRVRGGEDLRGDGHRGRPGRAPGAAVRRAGRGAAGGGARRRLRLQSCRSAQWRQSPSAGSPSGAVAVLAGAGPSQASPRGASLARGSATVPPAPAALRDRTRGLWGRAARASEAWRNVDRPQAARTANVSERLAPHSHSLAGALNGATAHRRDRPRARSRCSRGRVPPRRPCAALRLRRVPLRCLPPPASRPRCAPRPHPRAIGIGGLQSS